VSSYPSAYGITVAGACNGTSTTNGTLLRYPADILITPNGTLYVADNARSVLAFEPNNRTARTIATLHDWPSCIAFDTRTSEFYVCVSNDHLVYIVPGNRTIPPQGVELGNCTPSKFSTPKGIAVDSVGNVYIASVTCNWVMKWAPNATTGVVIAGSPMGYAGSSSTLLSGPYGLALDEPNSIIYVVDRENHRIQVFPMNGSGIGITVAGGNGAGNAANQLESPTIVYLSKFNDSIYICDTFNHRIQKWIIRGTTGVTVAGSPAGSRGNSAYLFHTPYGIALDPEEKYLYVSDTYNARVQKYTLS
jgi:DNA-binding beta-propeller fold protein YncE